jgi:hypothetical protein
LDGKKEARGKKVQAEKVESKVQRNHRKLREED